MKVSTSNQRRELKETISRHVMTRKDEEEHQQIWFEYNKHFGFASNGNNKRRLSNEQLCDLHITAFDAALSKGLQMGMSKEKAESIATLVSMEDYKRVWEGYKVPNQFDGRQDYKEKRFIPPKRKL